MPLPPDAAAWRPQPSRVIFLDLARAAAVLFMIQGHTVHQLLDQTAATGLASQSWLFLRGLTSCLFLLLSGFSFSVASDRYWHEFRRPSRRLTRRLGRFLFFLALGYLIQFPMGRFVHLPFANDERWRSFLQVDILQVVAVSLLLMQGLVILIGRRRFFALACGALAGLIVLATPLVWARPWAGTAPLWLASYLSAETGSNFPLFPWGGFMFAGAALGMAYARLKPGRPQKHAAAAFAGLGAFLLAAGIAAFFLPIRPFGDIDIWRAGSSIFVTRLGSILLLLGGTAFLSRSIQRLPAAIQALSQESLLIYVVHVGALYGSLWTPSLGRLLGRQDLPHTLLWIAALMASMIVLAWSWNHIKRHKPTVTQTIRFATAAALIGPLL